MIAHRHWAEIRKLLEQDFLCDSLKGRVRYFATRYRGAHDQTGRVCILVDGKKVLNMPYQTENEIHLETTRREPPKPGQSRGELFEKVKQQFQGQGI